MASTSFTINQPFIGAPFHFQPPLGSPDLERLIDAYIPGPAPKQDKMSHITIDLYTTATFDFETGALFKRYDVYSFLQAIFTDADDNSFEQSLFESSMTSTDSSYSYNIDFETSISPPSDRVRDARIAKKQKKDTKRTAELRLPGFSILTRDGVDVTTSTGRGTKTREQRQHAHLMRILKACDACKKKKIRVHVSFHDFHTIAFITT